MCAILDTILVFDMGACRLVSWWEDGAPATVFRASLCTWSERFSSYPCACTGSREPEGFKGVLEV